MLFWAQNFSMQIFFYNLFTYHKNISQSFKDCPRGYDPFFRTTYFSNTWILFVYSSSIRQWFLIMVKEMGFFTKPITHRVAMSKWGFQSFQIIYINNWPALAKAFIFFQIFTHSRQMKVKFSLLFLVAVVAKSSAGDFFLK